MAVWVTYFIALFADQLKWGGARNGDIDRPKKIRSSFRKVLMRNQHKNHASIHALQALLCSFSKLPPTHLPKLKSAMVQPLIWWVVIRRCGHVQPGIQEYNEEYLLHWELQESLMDLVRRKTRAFLENKLIAMGMIGLIAIYFCFVMLGV